MRSSIAPETRIAAAASASEALQGVGATLGPNLAGVITAGVGYDAAFLALAATGLAASLLFLIAMPEAVTAETPPLPSAPALSAAAAAAP